MTEPETDTEREYREQAWKEFNRTIFRGYKAEFMAGFDAARVFYTEWEPSAIPG